VEPPVELLVGDEAAVAAVRPVKVWHVACHGEFDQNDPRRSGILLADGRCTVADLMGLRLDCELVTFSACETGLAEQAPGDELIGLTRALIYAGARAVLVSLWSVDEISTSLLMSAFYRALARGVDKVTALSEAQHRVRTMTTADAIAYCQDALRHVDDPFVIELDIADLRFQAGDFAAAEAGYAALAERTSPGTPQYRGLVAAIARARRAQRVEAEVDYGLRPYEQPYHWAPFVLLGDWR
jgi:CHAT domain-containing protein